MYTFFSPEKLAFSGICITI